MFSKNRVVITGIGLITPVGQDMSSVWRSVTNGQSGISCFKTEHELGFLSPVAGQVGDFQQQLDAVLSPQEQRKTSRFIHLAMVAADEALKDAGLRSSPNLKKEQFGVYTGVGIGGLGEIVGAANGFSNRGYRAISPLMLPRAIPNEAPAWVSMKFGLQGPTMAVANACSSGNDAIGQAFRAIQDGHADYMLAGGAESCLTPVAFVGFGNMRALSSWKGDPAYASRPFDRDRSGFVMAEGAGFLLLEREDFARKRGAHVYAEVGGYGAHSDAYHMTAIHPDGRGAICAIESALKQGGVNKESIDYVNAHGTATPMNDPSETAVLKTVFGEHAKGDLAISSTKSMTGHMLGAAGGVEVALSALTIKHGILPPTINLEDPDPACDLDYVPHVAREKDARHTISNSFGFGGANSVILLKRYD